MTPIELAVFVSRVEAICQEMGATLRHAAFSPNIKDRLDFSCALFDVDGSLFAQAAHIPVHLGSMAYAMKDIVVDRQWQEGDILADIRNSDQIDMIMLNGRLYEADTLNETVTGSRARGAYFWE